MVIIKPTDLGNKRFEVQEGRVRFFAAPKAVFVVGGYESHHQICQIQFNKKDGGLFVSTPYFGSGAGILSNAVVGKDPPYTLSLDPGGKVTSHLVKLSHHPDGEVHFSQTRKIFTAIRRKSFRLADSIGEVFALHVYFPKEFEPIHLAQQQQDRVYLRNVFKGEFPSAITIVGQWRRKAAIEANTEPATGIVPPVTTVKHRKTGVESVVTLLGQPKGWPLRDHVLMLNCSPTTIPLEITEKAMVLMGGWDPHEVPNGGPQVTQTGCLVWHYPRRDAEELAKRIGSIDWWPGLSNRADR